MTSLFDKLNLRPSERRLVIIVALVVFLVVNAFLVWPRFLDWGKVKNQEDAAIKTRDQFQREVDNIKKYQLRLAELEQKGAQIGNEDQALKLSSTVYSQAALSGVTIVQYTATLRGTGSSGGKTNLFFDEQSSTIQFLADEKSLVDFLYNLGAGGSMIRVRSMTLNPDPPRYKLQGSITLVASYQRTAAARGTTATAPAPRPAAPAGTARPAPGATQSAISNAPPQKTSWLSRLWPFGSKKIADSARTNAPAKTNAPPKK
ncbi:MAG TPA: hypothetical protein VK530_13925 [Candidatus Acidoferrum sp.]|nr:hypothetical protein [Candidatus Acidoferrum sp.]